MTKRTIDILKVNLKIMSYIIKDKKEYSFNYGYDDLGNIKEIFITCKTLKGYYNLLTYSKNMQYSYIKIYENIVNKIDLHYTDLVIDNCFLINICYDDDFGFVYDN